MSELRWFAYQLTVELNAMTPEQADAAMQDWIKTAAVIPVEIKRCRRVMRREDRVTRRLERLLERVAADGRPGFTVDLEMLALTLGLSRTGDRVSTWQSALAGPHAALLSRQVIRQVQYAPGPHPEEPFRQWTVVYTFTERGKAAEAEE